MKFSAGAKVRLRFTGETGTVVFPLGDGMVQVRMDADASLIPAFEEDLQPFAELNKFAPPPPKNAGPPPLRTLKKSASPTGKGKGVVLVFEPMPGADEIISRYKTWLYNDSPFEFLFNFGLFIEDDTLMKLEGKMAAFTIYEVGDLLTDDLNDGPEAELTLNRITTAGADDEIFKLLKIKTKAFIKNVDYVDILNIPAHIFVIADNFEASENETSGKDDLTNYTKQKLSESKKKKPENTNVVKFEAFNVESFAHFEPEIDLHIQALMPGYAKLDKSEILRIQMNHFERFMERAIRLGVPRVFVIHGVGEGKLRDSIAQRLKSMYRVRKFKNEYHHKYGYGATEVFLD